MVASILGGCQGYIPAASQEAAKQAEAKDEAQEVVKNEGSSETKSVTMADPDAKNANDTKDADTKKKRSPIRMLM